MPGALDGVRVLDLGQYVAGPLAAMLLADQGADVVRVDPPGGPRWETPANAMWNRGKRRITLDLHEDADRETARRLIARSDVLIENFRPGVMARLGLDLERSTRQHPRLIACSIPGFASDDPRAGTAAWEGVVAAAGGDYRVVREAEGERAVYTAIPTASVFAAFLAATSVAAALHARERDGLGQRIEVAMLDAMYVAIGEQALRFRDLGELRHVWDPPFARRYRCADGRWLQFTARSTRATRAFAEAAGVSDWLAEPRLSDDPGLSLQDQPELAAELIERMTALFAARPAEEWEGLIAGAGVAAAVCRTTTEWIAHPQAHASEAVITIEDPRHGPMAQPGPLVRLAGSPGEIRGPQRALDADRDELLTELDEPAPERAAAPADPEPRGALEGVRVLDLCIVLAGPTCGRTLAELGAEVIKIDRVEPPGLDFFRIHFESNRGKRSILLDLKRPQGLEVFWQLVRSSDVIVQNFRKGVVERLGIDYERARAVRPDIVYASINGYGQTGPWAERAGWEQVTEASTGLMTRLGGDGPPVVEPHRLIDYGAGISAAYGVVLALFHRARTGHGQHVQTALTYTACTAQSPYRQGAEGAGPEEPRGQQARGFGPLFRLYRAADGWLFLGGRGEQQPLLARVQGIEELAGEGDAATLQAALEGRIAEQPVATWVERLTAAGFGAHRVTSVSEMMADARAHERGLALAREHEIVGVVETTGPAARLSRTPLVAGRPASRLGGDARAILEEIGLGAEYERLLRDGVIATGVEPAQPGSSARNP